MLNLAKSVLPVTLIFLFAAAGAGQTKSVEQIESEINALAGAGSFSVAYSGDMTTVKLFYDLREENETLRKPFKQFDIELIALYSGPGIDKKPYRNRLCITTAAKKFHFASFRDLKVRLDAEPVNFGSGERATQLKGRKATEVLCWDLDKEMLKEFADANEVGFVVGSWQVSIPMIKAKLFGDYWGLLNDF